MGWRTFSIFFQRLSQAVKTPKAFKGSEAWQVDPILAITMRPNMAQQLPTMLRLLNILAQISEHRSIAIIYCLISWSWNLSPHLGWHNSHAPPTKTAALSSTLHSSSPVVRTWGGRDSQLKLKSNHIIWLHRVTRLDFRLEPLLPAMDTPSHFKHAPSIYQVQIIVLQSSHLLPAKWDRVLQASRAIYLQGQRCMNVGSGLATAKLTMFQ